jgi:hypothetical protein
MMPEQPARSIGLHRRRHPGLCKVAGEQSAQRRQRTCVRRSPGGVFPGRRSPVRRDQGRQSVTSTGLHSRYSTQPFPWCRPPLPTDRHHYVLPQTENTRRTRRDKRGSPASAGRGRGSMVKAFILKLGAHLVGLLAAMVMKPLCPGASTSGKRPMSQRHGIASPRGPSGNRVCLGPWHLRVVRWPYHPPREGRPPGIRRRPNRHPTHPQTIQRPPRVLYLLFAGDLRRLFQAMPRRSHIKRRARQDQMPALHLDHRPQAQPQALQHRHNPLRPLPGRRPVRIKDTRVRTVSSFRFHVSGQRQKS